MQHLNGNTWNHQWNCGKDMPVELTMEPWKGYACRIKYVTAERKYPQD